MDYHDEWAVQREHIDAPVPDADEDVVLDPRKRGEPMADGGEDGAE